MRKGLFTLTATHGKKVGWFRRGAGYGELELEMTRRARCLNVRLHRTRVDDWVCRAHGAVLVERSKESIVVSPEAYGAGLPVLLVRAPSALSDHASRPFLATARELQWQPVDTRTLVPRHKQLFPTPIIGPHVARRRSTPALTPRAVSRTHGRLGCRSRLNPGHLGLDRRLFACVCEVLGGYYVF